MTALRWRATDFGDGPIPDRGQAYDGEISVGQVARITLTGGEVVWEWSCSAAAFGRAKPAANLHGMEKTKEAAKAALEAAWGKVLDAHPENRARIAEQLQRSRAHHEHYARLMGLPPPRR